jgi:hypothetical protein
MDMIKLFRRKSPSLGFIIIFPLLLGIISGCNHTPASTISNLGELQPTSSPIVSPTRLTTKPVGEEINKSPIKSVVTPTNQVLDVAGVKVELMDGLKREGDQIFANLCYELTKGLDWTPWEAKIIHENNTYYRPETLFLNQYDPQDPSENVIRCVRLFFHAPKEINPNHAILEIGSFIHLSAEGEYCSTNLKVIQKRLDAMASGIRVGCKEEDGIQDVSILEKPSGISQEEAQRIVSEAQPDRMDGPWVFTAYISN